MRKTVLVVVALAALTCAMAAWSQGPPPPGGPGGHGMASTAMAIMPPPAAMLDGLTKMLSLTTDQAASLKTVLTANDTALSTLQKTAAEACKAFRTAALASTYVEDDVSAARKAAEEAEAAVVDQCLVAWSQIRPILTADQLATLQAGPGPGFPPPGGQPPSGSGSSSSSSSTKRR